MGGRIRHSNTRFGRGIAWAVLFIFSATQLFWAVPGVYAAEITPIPPVTLPVPPAQEIPLPPAVTLENEPLTAVPIPSPERTLPPSQPTAPETGVPAVSQPLGPAPETETEKVVEEQGLFFNVANEDILEVVKQVSRALGKNFILDEKSCRGKITIISERKMTPEEVWETFLSSLDANNCTVREGPVAFYRLIPTREALSNPIELYLGETPYTDRFITRLITLKNISATDMANVIKSLVSKEGNLLAYPVTNTLILTDSGTNIERLMRLIKELDREGPQEVLEIIPIVYATAKDIAGKITEIFEEEGRGDGGRARPARRRGQEGESAEEIPRIRKVIPDERTNSVIVLASKRAIRDIRDLIRKLDTPLVGESGEIHVHYLRHAKAKDLAQVMTSLSGAISQAKDKGAQPVRAPRSSEEAALVTGIEFLGKWTVTADESTNALVITASAKDYQILVDQVISKLDIPRRQVYVEAVIVELSVSEDQQIGLGTIGGKAFNVGGNDIALFGSTFGFLDSSRLLGGSVGAANTGDTITINLPSTTGAAQSIKVPAFFTALQLSQGTTDVNILSTPNILTLDNEEAEIKVGQKVPFPAASATTIGGSLQTTFTREDVALTLKIKPQISESETIRLEVSQLDREVLPQQEQPSISAQAGPSTTERSIKTSIVAHNGQTIVLGGLIKDKYTTVVNKIPLLGDIPILGWLFKTRKKTKQKVNLVVFLTPHIIREPRDFLAILEKKIQENNRFIDDNFSRSQQKQIRTALAQHNSQLFSYVGKSSEEVPPEPEGENPPPAPSPAPTKSGGKASGDEVDFAP